MTKLLNRDDILRAEDIRFEKADMTPFGWGGFVWVKSMTGKERGQFEYDMQAVVGDVLQENQKKFRAKILVACVVDGDNSKAKRLFREEDVDALSEKHAGALDYLCDIAQRLSRMLPADVEALTKNLPGGQSEDSTTD
jgi:hypothetical protein